MALPWARGRGDNLLNYCNCASPTERVAISCTYNQRIYFDCSQVLSVTCRSSTCLRCVSLGLSTYCLPKLWQSAITHGCTIRVALCPFRTMLFIVTGRQWKLVERWNLTITIDNLKVQSATNWHKRTEMVTNKNSLTMEARRSTHRTDKQCKMLPISGSLRAQDTFQ
jgi:hypothetical protein